MNKPGINGHVGRFPRGFQFSKIFATLDWVPKTLKRKQHVCAMMEDLVNKKIE